MYVMDVGEEEDRRKVTEKKLLAKGASGVRKEDVEKNRTSSEWVCAVQLLHIACAEETSGLT